MSNESAPVVLVTGANTGLGLEIVKALISSDQAYNIVLLSRDVERGRTAYDSIKESNQGHSNVTVSQVDIENDASVDALYDFVEKTYGRVDYIVNNAGASYDIMVKNGQMSEREAWDKSYSLNVVSTHFFTKRFVPLLLKSTRPRIVFLSSTTASLTFQPTDKWPINKSPAKGWPKEPMFQVPAYRASKSACNMMALEWARVLRNDGVIVHIVDPGQMQTGFGGTKAELKTGHPHPSISAGFVKEVLEGKHDEDKEKLLAKSGVIPW